MLKCICLSDGDDMNSVAIVAAVVIVIIIIAAAAYLYFPLGNGGGPNTTKNASNGGNNSSNSGQNSSNKTLFSSSQYYPFSYLISDNASLSSQGQVATADFNLTHVELQNGSIEYKLAFRDTGLTYNVTLQKGDKLYFIDTNVVDDSPGADHSTLDDGYAVVDVNGYVVMLNYPLPTA